MIVPIYPPLNGAGAERFSHYTRSLLEAQKNQARDKFSELLNAEVRWARDASHLGEQQLIYEATVRVLTDLVRLRWRIIEQGYGFALQNPREVRKGRHTSELIESKAILREELRPIVEEQRSHPAVQDFLKRVEADGKAKRSVLTLIANEDELNARLATARTLAGEERIALLRSAVQPYLQLVTDEADWATGHNLREIWRYFRFSWSIPQTPVPGRQLLYLVRDAAGPNHPVIGLAGLNNCPLEMGETREVFIGWHKNAFVARVTAAAGLGRVALQQEIDWLEGRLQASLEEVEWSNLVTEDEVVAPTETVVRRLVRKSEDYAQLREDLLREVQSGDPATFDLELWHEDDAPPVADEVLLMEAKASADARMHAARKRLIAKKRASALARLLQARLTLRAHGEALRDPTRVFHSLEDSKVGTAINIILEALKARRAGANMLEITTCGAIQPYARLLGGKLVSMLMLSPQVAADYRAAYLKPSIISSQMRNQPVIRDNVLAYLGTTSLYVHGSSQYNRLRVPAGTIAPDQQDLGFQEVGVTRGFGTVQFSPETSRVLDSWLASRDSFKEVNSVFGEGTSPKLRKMKAGLRSIGFDPDKLMRHRQQRLIYAAPLWPGARDWLLERSAELPSYVANPEEHGDATERLVEHWCRRWLAGRIDRVEDRDSGQ
jgi:hypothetical protein